MRLGELCILDGKLAQYRGDTYAPDEPVHITFYAVSKIPESDTAPYWIGQVPWSPSNDFGYGEIRNGTGGRAILDARDWAPVTVRTPIPAPRDGRTYTWYWASASRSWHQRYLPLCHDCGTQHKDDLPHCGFCGIVLRNVNKHFKEFPDTCGNRELNPEPGIEVRERNPQLSLT